MHTLVSFLGRTHRPEQGYERIAYRFPDGERQKDIAFIGHGVAAYTRPDRLVVLGTSGSMWDRLLEDFPRTRLAEATELGLAESVDHHATSTEQLLEVSAALSEAASFEVDLRLIPDTPGMDETWQILHTLAEATAGSDRLSLDITHGFRHLPMVALMAALYRRTLAGSSGFEVEAIWYAQLPPGAKEAEMHDIAGILSLADWMEAIQRGHTTGDLSAVAGLLQGDAPQVAEDLARGTFQETIHQGMQARGAYRRVRNALTETQLPGPAGLFQPLLEAQTKWVEGQHLHERQAAQARGALERRDYLRAALYGYEAFITHLTRQNSGAERLNDHETREAAREAFIRDCRGRSRTEPRCRAFHQLRELRNVLAHGTYARHADVQSALGSPQALHELLSEALDRLLPPTEQS